MYRVVLGPAGRSLDLAMLLGNIGGARCSQGDSAGALLSYEESLAMFCSIHGEDAELPVMNELRGLIADLRAPG